jgi:hypothetical protein
VTVDVGRAAEALAAAAPELARVWRATRAAERPGAFPGLLDAIVEPFFALAAEGLGGGREPALVWPALGGAVRFYARDAARTREEIDAEWTLAEEVLHGACRALGAGDDARAWITQAIEAARAGTRRLPDRAGAPGILMVRVYSDLGATRRGARASSPP